MGALSVTVDLSPLIDMVSEESIERAKATLIQQVFDDSQVFIPRLTGALARSGGADLKNGAVSWNVPYANMVYNRDSVGQAINPSAQPAWFEHAKRRNAGDWTALVLDEILNGVE